MRGSGRGQGKNSGLVVGCGCSCGETHAGHHATSVWQLSSAHWAWVGPLDEHGECDRRPSLFADGAPLL